MLGKAGRKANERPFLARIFPFMKRSGRWKYSRLEGDHDALDSNSSLSSEKIIRRGENDDQDTVIKVTNKAYLTGDNVKADGNFSINTGAKLQKHFDENVHPQKEVGKLKKNLRLRERKHRTAIFRRDGTHVCEVGKKNTRQMASVPYVTGLTNMFQDSARPTSQKRTHRIRKEKNQFVKRTNNKLVEKLARENHHEPIESNGFEHADKYHKVKTIIGNPDNVTLVKGKRRSFHIKQAKGRIRKACKSVWKFTKSGLAYHTGTPGLDATLNPGLWAYI